MVVKCEITFDKNIAGTYFAGQMVNGTAILRSDKAKDVKAVLLKVSGYAATNWRERSFGKSRHYYGHEDYMESITYLLGSEHSNRNTIQPGEYAYSFAFQLPYNCPTSYEGRSGYIRYVVKVSLVRPWKFDQTYTRGFTVLRMIDLNYDTPQLRLPANSEAYKTFCCGPLKTEPLMLKLHVPQSGFVPGQVIPIEAIVINNTNIPVGEVKFSLVMLVRYFSQYPRHTSCVERIIVSVCKGDSVLRNCTRSLSGELPISATPPTCRNLCSLIQIAYQIEVEAKMKGPHGSQLITLPITIGNVPLCNSVVQQQPGSSGSNRASRAVVALSACPKDFDEMAANSEFEKVADAEDIEVPIAEGVSAAAMARAAVATPVHTEMLANLPPPSYEESVHTIRGDINEDELHAFGPCIFAPLYPVYNLASAPEPTNYIEPSENGGYVNESYQI